MPKQSNNLDYADTALIEETHNLQAFNEQASRDLAGGEPLMKPTAEIGFFSPVLRVARFDTNATLPTKAYDHAAAYDLYSTVNVTLFPGNPVKVQTGIATE